MNKKIIGDINNGTSIDHLVTASTPRVIQILNIDFNQFVKKGGKFYWIGGVDSTKYEEKAVLKVQNEFLDEEQKKQLTLICPRVTISEIKEGKVDKKYHYTDFWGDVIKNYLNCYKDTSCITMKPKEHVTPVMEFDGGIYKCSFCDSEYSPLELKFLRD